MTRPPTYDEAQARGLLTNEKEGIYTFSNGSDWDGWASGNCHACWYYNEAVAGQDCAFECAAFLGIVSPELAELFGWLRDDAAIAKYGVRSGYDAPDSCRFFRSRTDDNGNDNPPPPPTDPRQLVLLADPTEDAAHIQNVPERERVAV